MARKPRPKDWREKCREAYEEGGRGIGRMLHYAPEREPDIWAWIGGLKIWPRYYLKHFVKFWRQENPREYGASRYRKWYQAKVKVEKERMMREAREEARRKFGHKRE